MQAIDKSLGREPFLDWNEVDRKIRAILKTNDSKWRATEHKLFRDVFTAKDSNAEKVLKGKAEFEADPDLRDFENISLSDDIDDYFAREVLPHLPDAWMDRTKDKVGYEINFNRHFYTYKPPRDLAIIDAELKEAEAEILRLLNEVTT